MVDITIPGERLGSMAEYEAGDGTYVRNGYIYSKLCGKKIIRSTSEDEKSVLSVKSKKIANVVPEINSIAMCRVISNNPRFSKVNILSVNGVSLKGTFQGVIRQEDVRSTEKDRVKIYEAFRPNDIVLARILSLGDSHSYFLTTAENELGVIYALSEASHPLIPISWCEMQCTKTGKKEFRKVAKVRVKDISDEP